MRIGACWCIEGHQCACSFPKQDPLFVDQSKIRCSLQKYRWSEPLTVAYMPLIICCFIADTPLLSRGSFRCFSALKAIDLKRLRWIAQKFRKGVWHGGH
jgi:hypothetical protein